MIDLGVRYDYSGEGIPFVFQHGLASNLDQPQNLLAGIRDVKLISMDCPGHGASPLPESTLPSFRYYADQVMMLMEKLMVDSAILGGISMGAGIALNIALRFPEKIKALVLIRPAWLDKRSPANLDILLEAADFLGRNSGKEDFLKRRKIREMQLAFPGAAHSVLGVFDDTQREEIPMVLKQMVRDRPFDDISALEQIDKPCLVIGNDEDPLHPFEMTEEIHRRIRGCQIQKVVSRYVDDARHKQSINQLVLKFITTHEELLER